MSRDDVAVRNWLASRRELHMRLRAIDVIALGWAAFVVLVVVVPALAKKWARAAPTSCIYNLKMIYLDYSLFASEHGIVTQVSTNEGGTRELAEQGEGPAVHFRAIAQNEGILQHLVCPKDKFRAAGKRETLSDTNVSYFLSLNPPADAYRVAHVSGSWTSRWILTGDRNLNVRQAMKEAWWDATKGLHGERGYIVFLDGSVKWLGRTELRRVFEAGGNWSNRLAIPP